MGASELERERDRVTEDQTSRFLQIQHGDIFRLFPLSGFLARGAERVKEWSDKLRVRGI